MSPVAIIIVISIVALVFTVFAVMMVFAALGKRHHQEKNGRSRRH